MDNWDDLRFLVAVAKSGTMTGAARALGTNVATVSRRIDRLTGQLGVAPFVRTPEGWRPSEMVAGLIDVASAFEGRLMTELNSASIPSSTRSRTTVRVGCPPIVSSQILFPALVGTEGRLSAVSLEFSDRYFGEGLGEYDIILRLGRPETGRLRTKRAGQMAFRLYSPGPVTAEDWVGLSELHDSFPPMQMAHSRFARPPLMRVGGFMMLHDLMEQTGLPGPLPEILGRKNERMTPVDCLEPPFVAEFWLAYHESRKGDPAIEATVEWIDFAFGKAATA